MSDSPPSASAPRAGHATQADLYNQVFGGEGSDISDLSDSDNGRPAKRLAFPIRHRSPSGSVAPEDDDDDDDRDDDVYVPGTMSQAAKIPKFKRVTKEVDVDADADMEGEERKRKKTKKRRVRTRARRVERREEREEEAAPVYDEETRESPTANAARFRVASFGVGD